ncbi:MAG TPA: transglutaminase family protein [Prosthecobacter sp.]|nr:transglutaminase family protein [Prosthecobacter sp.]
MAIHVALRHVTRYDFDRPVSLSPHVVRLRPAPHCRTKVLSYSLKVTPEQHFINWQQDPQSNHLARLVFPEKTRSLCVEVDLVAEMAVYNPFDFFLEPQAEHFPFKYDPALAHELEPFHRKLPLTPQFTAYLREVRHKLLNGRGPLPHAPVPHSETADTQPHGILPEPPHEPVPDTDKRPRSMDFLVQINQMLWSDIRYTIRMEPGVQTPEETLELLSGSCRDSAWLLVQLLRHLGLAARFVSGYLIQLKPDVKALDGPSGAETDFTDLHAWCEVYLPGAGWIGLDPTSGLLAGEGHLPLAATPDPSSAAPITGLVDKCEVQFGHEMHISRVHETPRVTKPYTPEQWAAIEALGHRIDSDLLSHDVRLTMGGEPTFVSIDDMDGEEWNTAAVGPQKRLLSGQLIKRLRARFAPGALLHYGTGKWYPGEPLPRWALGCYWRKDGVPVWKDDSLIADESKNLGHNEADARAFGLALASALQVDTRWLKEAYEDVYYYLWREKRLPVNVDPLQSNLKDELERARLARLFEHGLDQITGFILPIERAWQGGQLVWKSGPWFVRDDTLHLIPGDSPMGLRLPLDSLPWVSAGDYPWIYPTDPASDWPELPPRPDSRQRIVEQIAGSLYGPGATSTPPASWRQGIHAGQGKPERRKLPPLEPEENDPSSPTGTRFPRLQESASWIIRTALCFEPREGRLHVFMPPVAATEDYLDLISAIEDVAATLAIPIVIEGTSPPYDPRLHVIKVTPDPGVIEVNMHPVKTWGDLVENTTALYEEARLTRLGTEKFMVDGRHTGTGGGNHIVVGGESPRHSPFLRRPDLLKSLIGYWHNHPSLSYLFSGLFIGPTSQHPRVDEARNDALFELELAFKELDRQTATGGFTPPWLVDRIFRNLLVDATGNTHRSEFCIDKLFDPGSSTGRLGLVELRSFEMPPHAEMSLAQHLLLRAALARFWQQPYEAPLVRWGTELHDRFLLPHFVWQDFSDVIEDMADFGYPLSADWFAPHFEFKFPTVGSITGRGVHLDLRTALEPWHVLGEDGAPGGTVRYVDSSLERIQVKTAGLVNNRHLITCNGRIVPLHPTGTVGEYVAGVRYRAWQPPNCLQPTIGVHSPLVFDIVDTWNQRSIAGCTCHVAHPGGRSYDTFPVNSYEAESRRLARFFPGGHTPGKMQPVAVPPVPEFPLTLDLRRG